jgi:hypothetical protein
MQPLCQFIKDGVDQLRGEFIAQDCMVTEINASSKMEANREKTDINKKD